MSDDHTDGDGFTIQEMAETAFDHLINERKVYECELDKAVDLLREFIELPTMLPESKMITEEQFDEYREHLCDLLARDERTHYILARLVEVMDARENENLIRDKLRPAA